MGLFKGAREFIMEEEFKITYLNNKVNIVNYTNITHFDSDKIIVNYSGGSVVLSGNNLFVSKLLTDEVLIEGIINKIEFR